MLEARHLLNALGYPLGKPPPRSFDVRIRGAISYFQRKDSLPATGYPDPATLAAMRGVAASLRPASAREQAPPHDLVERALGDNPPILPIALALAFVLGLLALSARRSLAQDSPTADESVSAPVDR